MIAMSCSRVRGLTRLAELLLCVLSDRLQEPVSRSAAGVFGDDKRLVHQQRQLIEDLVALYIRRARHGLGCVQVEAAKEYGQPAE